MACFLTFSNAKNVASSSIKYADIPSYANLTVNISSLKITPRRSTINGGRQVLLPMLLAQFARKFAMESKIMYVYGVEDSNTAAAMAKKFSAISAPSENLSSNQPKSNATR